ncbi:MAG TPA: DNA replication/repair protein RecF [Anaerolineales bacterium]|nr:DNA replication/repair protein RecF [Anaerolineales bacterium]
MQLTRLSLTNIRSIARLDINIPAGTILIVGKNAQGKTSILEAIYYLATLSSFHASKDSQLINLLAGKEDLSVGRIIGEFTKQGRSHRLEVRIIQERTRSGSMRGRKEVLLDGVKKRSREIIGQFNAVLFLPQMMQIIEGSPDERRRYLDLAISQVVPNAATSLNEYRKLVTQRNALLKQLNESGGSQDQLDFWDERLAKRGAQIIADRIMAVQEMDLIAGRIHHQITNGAEVLRLDYLPSFDPLPAPKNQPTLLYAPPDRSQFSTEQLEKAFLEALKANRRMEIARGMTTIGPHRDDLAFLSNGIDLGVYGSRGQVRTALMTLKLAEMTWMKEKTGNWPVLLLDEVLAELDEDRRVDLLARVSQSNQSLLTTTDMQLFDLEAIQDWQQWHIHQGNLQAVKSSAAD